MNLFLPECVILFGLKESFECFKKCLPIVKNPTKVKKFKDQSLQLVLAWWKRHQAQFPILALLACQVLSATATSAPAERLFSAAGQLYTPDRNHLSPEVGENQLTVHMGLI